jgi:hypothetical protein
VHRKDFNYSESEKELNKVVKLQDIRLKKIASDSENNISNLDETIQLAEQTLVSLGRSKEVEKVKNTIISESPEKKIIVVRSWEEISNEACQKIPCDVSIKDIFTEEELQSNEEYLVKLREEFNALHRLDAIDYTICGIAGILAAAVDILLVGIPEKTKSGIQAGPLSNYIRKLMEEKLPPEEMERLGKTKAYKVPFDPQDNRNLSERVEGLSSWFHRFQSLGHDPILGFIIGVLDVMKGKFTAIDVNGNLISQVAPNQSTNGMKLFDAIALVFRHMKSDVTTSMGLPAPLMTLFNFFQFGNIGEEELNIAEVARGMYAEGYDFTHFLSMSVSPIIIEVLVRTSYFGKRMHEGHGFKDSLPIDLPFNKKPKLGTMLFIAHSIATAVNAGKVAFTENPLSVNYSQWLAFAKYSISQLKWILLKKPALRNKYVQGFIDSDWEEIDCILESTWDDFTKDAIVLYK